MRATLSWMLAVGLALTPAIAKAAGPGDGKDTSAAAKSSDAAATPDKAAQPSAAKSESKPDAAVKPGTTTVENELQQLKDLLEAQSRQIQLQNEQLRLQQAKMDAMEADLKTASANVANITSAAASAALTANPAAGAPSHPAIDPELYFTGADEKNPDEPLAIHFKGITITPGGFIAAESVYRNRALGADVNTPFNSVPLPFSDISKISENNFSGRQSRITLLAEGKLADVKLTGYYETDWLGVGVTSNNNQTNSYVNRQRQIWGQAAFTNGVTITGGQMWSLLTETKHGLDNRTEGNPMTIDAQYQVGFTWARQYGVRFTKNFGDKLWFGLSVEDNALNSITAHVSAGSTAVPTSAFFALVAGNGSGLYNNALLNNNAAQAYALNASPDFIVKAAWEPGWGHYEIFGIVSTFHQRIYPCETGITGAACGISVVPNTSIANNQEITIGGVGGNVRLPFFNHKLDVILHAVWGDGTARYGSSGLPDATIHADGSLAPIRDGQAMVGLEFHPTPKWDIYGYGGAEYDARTWYPNFSNTTGAINGQIGYGAPAEPGVNPAFIGLNNTGCFTEAAPGVVSGITTTAGVATTSVGSCVGDTRYLAEGTIGFWRRLWAGPKGRLQVGMQYSYVVRDAWSGAGTATGFGVNGEPRGLDSMFFTSFRYYFP
jgi:hypothetical protein